MLRSHIERVTAVTAQGTGSHARRALPIAALEDIVAAAAARVADRAHHVRTHCQQTRPTLVRDLSTPTTVAGDAKHHSIRRAKAVRAARISHAAPTSIAQVRVITRMATATSAIAALRIARLVSIVKAVAARVRARVLAARTSLRMRHTLVRDLST